MSRRKSYSGAPRGEPFADGEDPRRINPWPKGQSGNPLGKTPGIRVFKERMAELTNNYLDLANMLYDIAFGRDETMMDQRVRFAALVEILDRGLGKVKQSVDVAGPGAVTPEQVAMVTVLQLSPHERKARILELKAKAEQPRSSAPAPVLNEGENVEPDGTS